MKININLGVISITDIDITQIINFFRKAKCKRQIKIPDVYITNRKYDYRRRNIYNFDSK